MITIKHTKPLRRLVQIAIFLTCCSTSYAQRIIGELETNTDQDMMLGPDTTQSDKNSKKIVPVDVKAWTIDENTGARTDVDVDTLHHLYENNDLPEGIEGHYNTLGNLGSPRQSRIFFDRDGLDWDATVTKIVEAQVSLADLIDIDIIIADLSVIDIIEPVDQVRDRRLSGSG